MTCTDKEIRTKINAKLSALEDQGMPWHATWIAHAICHDHEDGLSDHEDSDFWKWGGYKSTRDLTRRCVNERASIDRAGDKKEAQPNLPGFDHLQQYYMVDRNGDELGVPIFQMTDAEVEAKSAQLRTMGEACFAHADELMRFKDWRRLHTAE